MNYINRTIEPTLNKILAAGLSVLLLGPRQTGKTTLIKRIAADWLFSLITPKVRQRYERDPDLLAQEVRALHAKRSGKIPLVIIDEVQKVPDLLDVAQALIDDGLAQFILTGSSARKLKQKHQLNLLPGRVIALNLHALSAAERNFDIPLEALLLDGSLPKIVILQDKEVIENLLATYIETYLEEEIRQEALVRNVGDFSRFLELAASESGKIINFSKLSQQIGITNSIISGYYQILEDCLVAHKIEPYTKSNSKRRVNKGPKYLFFDLGVRRAAAREGRRLPKEYMGSLLEQFVAIEFIRLNESCSKRAKIYYWRDVNGIEVDWVLEYQNKLLPIEVKWTEYPNSSDARHLKTFLKEHPQANMGYIICQTPQALQIEDNITAISWQEMFALFSDFLKVT